VIILDASFLGFTHYVQGGRSPGILHLKAAVVSLLQDVSSNCRFSRLVSWDKVAFVYISSEMNHPYSGSASYIHANVIDDNVYSVYGEVPPAPLRSFAPRMSVDSLPFLLFDRVENRRERNKVRGRSRIPNRSDLARRTLNALAKLKSKVNLRWPSPPQAFRPWHQSHDNSSEFFM